MWIMGRSRIRSKRISEKENIYKQQVTKRNVLDNMMRLSIHISWNIKQLLFVMYLNVLRAPRF
jgi:hypothetical protein